MKRIGLRAFLALLVLAVALFVSCGDNDPAEGTSACLEDGTSCLTINAGPDDMEYTTIYSSFEDETYHTLTWSFADDVVEGFGPGQNISVTLRFNPPLAVRYDHTIAHFAFANTGDTGCVDTEVNFDVATRRSSNWPKSSAAGAIYAECTTDARSLSIYYSMSSLRAGQEHNSITFEFTVPDAYATGVDAGTPIPSGDLGPLEFRVRSTTPGQPGERPVWPKGVPLQQ